MLERVLSHFSRYPGRASVARALIALGLSVRKGRVLCGEVEIKDAALARAVGVDRRVVRSTVEQIEGDRKLKALFGKIRPAGTFLRDVAKDLGFGVVEISAEASKSGIISSATALVTGENISIRQVYAEDPELVGEPKLIIITERHLPGKLLEKFLKIPGVTRVSIY
ncbi:MAG: amino acid-binding protein [Candidatus Micrarchaeota archaeon]|nr:amino acid-binding protein [Candidatus Micrarchaeota archaeon]